MTGPDLDRLNATLANAPVRPDTRRRSNPVAVVMLVAGALLLGLLAGWVIS